LFDYCITVYGQCANKNISLLQSLQNRAARAVTGNFSYEVSPKTLIKELNWMSIKTRFIYFLGILVFKSLNNMAPPFLSNSFDFYDQDRHYHTRAVTNHNMIVPRVFLANYKSSIAFLGPTLWNQLPIEIKGSTTLYSFKSKFKTFLKSNHLLLK
jgi:hypothetical protein